MPDTHPLHPEQQQKLAALTRALIRQEAAEILIYPQRPGSCLYQTAARFELYVSSEKAIPADGSVAHQVRACW